MKKMQYSQLLVHTPNTSFNEYVFPLRLGKDEVVEVQYISANIELSGVDTYLRLFFNRKTAKADKAAITPETEETVMRSPDTFWSCAHFQYMTTSGVHNRSKLEQIYFPVPLILLREPRILAQGSTGQKAYIFFYYIKKIVREGELTRMMVKAHS